MSAQQVVQNISATIPNGVFNLEEIDWPLIFAQLVTPKGLVTQFSLELLTQTIFTSGWVIVGGIWQWAVINDIGGTQE